MPKFLEKKLRQEARKKGFSGKKADQYVYGGMNNMGAMHGSKETAKGAEMEKKHEDKMKKGSGHNLRRMEIEVHRDKAGAITGHTVHHYSEPPKSSSKSGAFLDGPDHTAHPFGAGQHKEMLAHISKHLSSSGLAAAESGEPGGEGDDEGPEDGGE